jgi:hypothetical protein
MTPTWQTTDGSVKREDPRPVHIYALLCPSTNRVRYVGKTVSQVGRRVIEHMNASKRTSSIRLHRWLRKVGKPRVIVLQVVASGENWQGAESRWIRRFRMRGFNLCNHTDGGEGLSGHHLSEEHRARIGNAIRTGEWMKCEVCDAAFYRKQNQILKGDCRFCSRSCYFTWQRGKEKTMPMRTRNDRGRYVS